jgi:hypothetical protein
LWFIADNDSAPPNPFWGIAGREEILRSNNPHGILYANTQEQFGKKYIIYSRYLKIFYL